MSNYGAIVTTQLGKNMIAESLKTKKGIIFTKIALGEGLLNNNNIDDLTGLLAKVADGQVSTVNTISNSEIEVVSTINNRALTRGYYARELGLFAKLGENGAEKLFAYTNAGANASYVPSNASIDEKIITITIGIGNASVTLNPKSHIYLTEARLNQHENDINAHSDIMNKYLRLIGGTVTGNIRLNNASVGFNNGNDTYDAKIRIAPNGNFDIGVTEDSTNKNATNQLLLHSQIKPKWYNSANGGKEIATTEDITNHNSDKNAHQPITSAIAKILGTSNWEANPAATLKDIKNLLGMGGIVAQRLEETGFIKFANGFIIQWGILRRVAEAEQGGNGNENQQLRRFPIPFATNKAILVCGDCGNNKNDSNAILAVAVSGAVSVRGRIVDKTSFKVAVDTSDGTMDVDISYIAVGI